LFLQAISCVIGKTHPRAVGLRAKMPFASTGGFGILRGPQYQPDAQARERSGKTVYPTAPSLARRVSVNRPFAIPMIRYSILIPERERADDVRRQLPALTAALDRMESPHEIIVVDDASTTANLRLLEKLRGECPSLRVLRLDSPGGTSVALTAGIAAARGETVIVIEAGETYSAEQVPWLVSWLSRADFVAGRRRQTGLAKLLQRFARIPRWLLLGLESHDPDCLFWAARREVVANLRLTPGMCRYLPAIVSRRGYRVCDAYVEHQGELHRLQDVRPNPADLLAAWWMCRRWREPVAHEAFRTDQPALRVLWREDAEQIKPTITENAA
jgi:dolichol-phosphate mannosyltransferase